MGLTILKAPFLKDIEILLRPFRYDLEKILEAMILWSKV